jgi:uncharacterized sulfatase
MSQWTRRGFAGSLAAGFAAHSAQVTRPNILWITCEDTGPHLHACGDPYSVTPNLDALAARGTIYRNAWSNAPVCAPARTTIISGMYPPSTGSEHMRSMTHLPAGMKMFPQYLREAGYYCTNNFKEDYNLEKRGAVWDVSSRQGHWRNRASGQPFFSVFNLEITHESQIRTRPHQWIHDPSKARIPAYHPDTREVREDWAQYYDNITTMDGQAGNILADLRKDGLAEDTIVIFFGDHGSGMPRSKRWPYNSGLNVSIVAHIPEKFRGLAAPEYKAGGQTDRLVGFVDLAPTMLSLAGIKPPDHLQGRAFLGPHNAPERAYNYGFRGRMDERYDMVRSVRDKRYVYVRNYMPHKIYGQYLDYMFQTPTTRVWKRLFDEGKLNAVQSKFWQTKPAEELFDLTQDPDEVRNLAEEPAHRATLERLRKAQREWAAQIRDVGFLPEGEIHSRSEGSSPYDAGHDEKRVPLTRIVAAAESAASLKSADMPQLIKALADSDSAVRYWAAMGILMRGAGGLAKARPAIEKALADPSIYVRIVAAETLGRYGSAADLAKALDVLVAAAPADRNGGYVSLFALNALDELGAKAKPAKAAIQATNLVDPKTEERSRNWSESIAKRLLAQW